MRYEYTLGFFHVGEEEGDHAGRRRRKAALVCSASIRSLSSDQLRPQSLAP